MYSMMELEIGQLNSQVQQLQCNLAAAETRLEQECNASRKYCQLYTQAMNEIAELKAQIGAPKCVNCQSDTSNRLEITQDSLNDRGEGNMRESPLKVEPYDPFYNSSSDKHSIRDRMDSQNYEEQNCSILEAFSREMDGPRNANTSCMESFNSYVLGGTSKEYFEGVSTNSEVYSCDVCGKCYLDLAYLAQHITRVHRRRVLRTQHQCVLCSSYFADIHSLKRHVDAVHIGSAKRHLCPICNTSFTQISNLRTHIRSVHEGLKFRCHICEKQFSRKNTLRAHVKTHSGVYSHACEICGKGFIHNTSLSDHRIREHKNYTALTARTFTARLQTDTDKPQSSSASSA